jgi:peptidoglycan pentaglycine glycine transferase (the first glycine)
MVAEECGAQVLFRKLPAGLSIAYIPKGPIGRLSSAFLQELDIVCKKRHAIFLKIEPDLWEEDNSILQDKLGEIARDSLPIQPFQTITLDIRGGEETVMSQMKQKTRYNIRLAEKKGIIVREWDDLPGFGKMMNITASRDGFGVHPTGYYQIVYNAFAPKGMCKLFVAEYNKLPLAALMVMRSGSRAWYFYGASTDEERNRMPTYLLQWQAIQWAMVNGCSEYDLWGIPDAPEYQLEEQFSERSDGLWGVYRFKRGFGGQVKRSAGAWDRVYSPILYSLYQAYISRRRADYAG